MLLVALAWSLLSAAPAHAASGDQIDSFKINYEVRDTGVVRVTETITYRFGDNSGRHGIERYLVVREPYDESQDAVYGITEIDVSSPDPDVATQWSRTDSEAKDGREVQARLRIGDPDETISADTATYVIAYDLSGAMRTSGTFDEFYWDATGLDWKASIKQVDITGKVPGGVQDTTCTYGPVNSTQQCTATVEQWRGHLPAEQPGRRRRRHHQRQDHGWSDQRLFRISNRTAPSCPPTERLGAIVIGAAGLVVLIGSPLVGVLWWRKHGRDQRYAGLAPGTTPLAGQPAHIVANDPDLPIPVAFSPPRIPVAEAGLLVDGQVDAPVQAGRLTVQS